MEQNRSVFSPRAATAVPTQEPEKHLLCGNCSQLAFNCLQTGHGCRLCLKCVIEWQRKRQRDEQCPCGKGKCPDVSNESLIQQAHCLPDFSTRREICDMAVRCPNFELGCGHTCKRKLVDDHLATSCEFEVMICELCDKSVRKIYHNDLQSTDCCERFKGPCPMCNDPKLFDRRAFQVHLEYDCPRRLVSCMHSKAGCEWTGCWQDLEQHSKDNVDAHMKLHASRCHERIDAVEEMNRRSVVQRVDASSQTETGRDQRRIIETNSNSKTDLQDHVSNDITRTVAENCLKSLTGHRRKFEWQRSLPAGDSSHAHSTSEATNEKRRSGQ